MGEIGLRSKRRLNPANSVEIRRETKRIPSKFIPFRRNSTKDITETDRKSPNCPRNRPIYENPTVFIQNMMDNQDSDVSK